MREYLVSRGVPAGRLEVTSYGKERPIEICSAESCYAKNRRAVIVDEGWRSGSLSAEVMARIMEQGFWSLDGPIARVCTEEVPIPYPKHLEDAAIPQVPKIVAAAKSVMGR